MTDTVKCSLLILILPKMSKSKTAGLFRPWDSLETANEASEIITDINTLREHMSCSRQEDDERIVSSTTSTAEAPEVCDDHLLNRRTVASTSLSDFRHARIRGRVSSDDVASRTTPSLEDENTFAGSVQNVKKNSRVPRSQQPVDSMVPVSCATSTRDSDEFNDSSDVISPDCLSTLTEFRSSEGFASINDGVYPITNSDVARPPWTISSMIESRYVSDVPRIHSGVYPAIHPGFQAGIYPGILPLNFYNHSMEEAVQMVHRQDAVAKEIKKMRPKKHNCPHCSMAFSNGGQLTGHIRIHTGERPFKCDVESCGKRFTRNEELTRHKRIHTGVRPYSCVFCKKRFGRKDHLKKHMRTHEARDSYRVSTAALGVIASLSYPFQHTTELGPYLYQI